MNEGKGNPQASRRCWVGLDWGSESHAVSVVDDDRQVIDQFTIGTSLDGLGQLAARLRRCGTVAGIAIEATRQLVVAYLVSAQFRIYPINPKMSKRWRECTSVAGIKNDVRDGLVLAVELARRHESLRPFTVPPASVAELAGLCETLRDLIDERTALVQRLEEILNQYHPCALNFFSDWVSPTAWQFVRRFPNPASLAHARKDTLIRFLKAHRIGLRPLWLDRIEARGDAERWPHPANAAALEIAAVAVARQLLALQPSIDQCDALIAERASALPEAALIQSLPGVGPRLAPALTAMVVVAKAQSSGLAGLRCLAGVAPAEDTSCKRQRVRLRRRCNKHWRNILHLFAWSSTNHCEWARAFYHLHREHGDSHAGALRKLADKWLKIIARMLTSHESYDNQRYTDALKNNHSPIYTRLCEKGCG